MLVSLFVVLHVKMMQDLEPRFLKKRNKEGEFLWKKI
jgi:hypothetical protein